MNKLFDDQSRGYSALPVELPLSVSRTQVNGSAVFCSWPDEHGVGHSRFVFDDVVADALFAEKYHHKLLLRVDEEMSHRRSHCAEPADGALLRIEHGDVSVCWVAREEAERVKRLSQHSEAVEELRSAYIEALKRADLETLFSAPDALSGVFLPCPVESYFASNPRVIVVGQETRGWRNESCELRNTRLVNDAGVDASMQCAREFASYGARRSKFLQFYRHVSSQVAPGSRDAAVWSNQFCVSFESGSPLRLPDDVFRAAKQLSYDLLRAQIDILQPQVVIFTTGPTRDRYLKECFPGYKTVEVFEPRRLWHFKIGNIHCLRTSHPRWVRGAEHLNKAVNFVTSLSDS